MKRTAALAMLKEFEELEGGHHSITTEDVQWWEENILGVPAKTAGVHEGPVMVSIKKMTFLGTGDRGGRIRLQKESLRTCSLGPT